MKKPVKKRVVAAKKKKKYVLGGLRLTKKTAANKGSARNNHFWAY
jgi:hypothetical protein